MAFQVSRTSARQTALKAGADIAIAELNAGFITSREELVERVSELRDEFYADLEGAIASDEAALPSGGMGGSFQRGGQGSSGPRVEDMTDDEVLDTVVNFGAFKGLTYGEVRDMNEAEAATYSASQGKSYTKSGRDWLRWSAANKDPKARKSSALAQRTLDAV